MLKFKIQNTTIIAGRIGAEVRKRLHVTDEIWPLLIVDQLLVLI